jgi:hypothetical protein
MQTNLNTHNKIISVFPNPNTGKFTVIFGLSGEYQVINSIGQLVTIINSSELNNNEVELNLSAGIYYLTGNGVNTKIIITN